MCIKIHQNACNRTLLDRWIGYSLADLIKFIYKLCLLRYGRIPGEECETYGDN